MRLIDADELITAFPCGESVRTECVRATINNMPTIEVSEDDLYIPLNNQTVERINRLHKDECGEYFDEEWLFNELEQISEFREVSEDCISRATALEIYSDLYWIDERLLNFKSELDKVYDDLRNAPSVIPQPKEGEWIPKQFPYDWYYPTCSVCGFKNKGELNNYCPNCGAKMKGACK